MQLSGIGMNQIAQVRGFADQLPRISEHPEDPSNRRITLIVEAGADADEAPGKKETAPTASQETAEMTKAASPDKER